MLSYYFNRSSRILLILTVLFALGCSKKIVTHQSDTEPSPEPAAQQNPVNPEHDLIQSAPQHTENHLQAHYDTVWERMIALYSLPDVQNARINREIKRYLKNPDHLATIQKRAEPYIYAIIQEIESKNLPGELALLPVVESAFKPRAYSRSRASGLWQFIPSTGRYFGLKQNWWYDGRRDIHKSTQMATRYLKELNQEFDDDWFLALASYNAGKGNVAKAIRKNRRKNKPTDYWNLPLPRETRNYVPRLLAISRIFAQPEKYNLSLRPIPNKPVYEPVDIGSQLDLATAAKMANTPMDDFINLNPGFNRRSTAPDGPHLLLIPVDQVEAFKENLARLPEHERLKWTRHKIKRGENLGMIARKYGTTVSNLRHANQLNSSRIHTGRHLVIPSSLRALNYPPKQRSVFKKKIIYIVKRGDTFWDIARRFSVSSRNIAKWNRISLKKHLFPGQKLVINQGNYTARTSTDPFHPVLYTVKKGDSLVYISNKYKIPVSDLRKWNAEKLGPYIHPGQTIKVSKPAT